MAKVVWDEIGTRYFESGVDRGVLYLAGVPGVPWSGLTGVSEAPSGGTITPSYIDGVKYQNAVAREDFEATITAYTYPLEFDSCIGVSLISNGLFATHQKKKSFGFAYRTQVGNDIDGPEHAYKIHLVYNATAETSDQNHKTNNASMDADEFSWHIVTKPPLFSDYSPTAHFVIDTRTSQPNLISQLEDILYGTDADEPRLPSIDELIFLFSDYADQSFDAGVMPAPYVVHYDAGLVGRIAPDAILDGGAP